MKKLIAAFIAAVSAATVSAQPDKDWLAVFSCAEYMPAGKPSRRS